MSTASARQERHLEILDELTEVGMALAERLRQPAPNQDVARDFEIISRGVRRSILLSLTISSGTYTPPQPTGPRPERDPAAGPAAPRDRSDTLRLDPLDRLDTISGPFEQVVAEILRDVHTVLSHLPKPPPLPTPAGQAGPPHRPEADLATLE